MKEQRIRCLLQGTWFPNQSTNTPKPEETRANGGNTSTQAPPRRQSWRYVKLSHNRRDLHYDDFDYKTAAGKEPTLESLEYRLDLSVVSSVVSNVEPSSRERSDSTSSGSTVRTSSKPDHGRRGSASRRSHTNTEIVIHGRVNTASAHNGGNAHKDGGNARNNAHQHNHQTAGGAQQTHRRELSSRSDSHTASTNNAPDEETALLTLHPTSQTLASEWLDGLLLLLNQAPITAETNKLVDFIAKYGLRIRLLNVRFEEDGFVNGEASRKVDIPGHEGIDEDYFYDIGGGA